MIINNGPIGRRFNPLKDLLIKFENGSFNKLNRDGENNKYFLAYPPNQSDWYLIIFDSCYLEFTKEIENIEIGLIGAGGGGGGHTPSDGNGHYNDYVSAGAGGGAGGYKVTKMIETFEKDIYQLTIGAPDENYGDGGKTSIKNQLNTFIIEANGGLAGKNSTGYWHWAENGYSYEYRSAGAGGEGTYPVDVSYLNVPIGTIDSPSSASGGDGTTGHSDINSGDSIPTAEAGGYGKSLFTKSLFQSGFTFNDEIISDMIIVGAGGGGGGSTAYQYGTNYKPYIGASYGKTPNENIDTNLGVVDAIYGRGGNGLGGNVASIDPRLGGKGLIIIRHKKSSI